MDNLFTGIPDDLPNELIDVISSNAAVRIERIVSRGHRSPDGFWYDQDQSEWVVVLRDRAGLLFQGDERPVEMAPGDHVVIPAHRRHRVEWTDAAEATVWLAVFFDGEPGAAGLR